MPRLLAASRTLQLAQAELDHLSLEDFGIVLNRRKALQLPLCRRLLAIYKAALHVTLDHLARILV
jgi:hypothetical protein